jgi:PadR family transcriptional regulator, regulatory protein PadR
MVKYQSDKLTEWLSDMAKDFRLPSGKEVAVLELLVTRREMYGLEMVHACSKLGRGTIYVLLNRMEDKGYVKSRQVKETNQSGLPRRVYSVTGLGQRALHAWQQARASFAMAPAFAGGR